uniref:Potassium channel domain-containing protein n=1 Tax=Pithovirus LCPAC201 TaxID=2506591 RepID=A0A481Z758_9VIRU|nr:MAG: uncharacterized protein LCPAC201_02210 [Pithovirus LCPAC201]
MYSLLKIVIIVVIISIFLIFLGAAGYHYILGKDMDDAFYLSVLTMSGLSLETKPKNTNEKIFVAVYTLISIGFYLILIAAIIACFLEPIVLQVNNKNILKSNT